MTRQRGIVLTPKGKEKIESAIANRETLDCRRYTYSEIVELIEKSSIQSSLHVDTLKKIRKCQKADKSSVELLFETFEKKLEKDDYKSYVAYVEWGDVPSNSAIYGRTEELDNLEQWVLRDKCRLIALLGQGGIGKTTLAVEFAKRSQDHFDFVIARSLRQAPHAQDLLGSILQVLLKNVKNKQQTEINLPESTKDRITLLIEYMRKHRCLIILDNFESILGSGRTGQYQEGYDEYADLLNRVGEAAHTSCIVLTSRENPEEVVVMEERELLVRSLPLSGLQPVDERRILEEKGLVVTESQFKTLTNFYAGNPLCLKIAAASIDQVFHRDVNSFLEQQTGLTKSIQSLLESQVKRLSDCEMDMMYWLAINREPVELSELSNDFASPTRANLIQVAELLQRRSLVQINRFESNRLGKGKALFTLQPVIMEYVSQQLVERVVEEICEDIHTQKYKFFKRYALMKASSKDYIRAAQNRYLLQPVLNRLLSFFNNKRGVKQRLDRFLQNLRDASLQEQGYAAGNSLNMLIQLGFSLRGYDLSDLVIWQVDFRSVQLQDVNFARTDLANCVFAQPFGGVFSLATSPNGKTFATGHTTGEIILWNLSNGDKIRVLKRHAKWVVSLAFSPDSTTLASGSTDNTVREWDIATGRCTLLQGHSNQVWSVAFSPDGQTLASGSDDRTIRLWNRSTSEYRILNGHTHWVTCVCFSSNNQTLASGSHDKSIRLWNFSTGDCKILTEDCDEIRSLCFSPDGQRLASGSDNGTIRLWDLNTGECKILGRHSAAVWCLAFRPQDSILASASHDYTIKLWDLNTGECRDLTGHSGEVFSVTFSERSKTIISGSRDQTVKEWEVSSGSCLRTWQGYSNKIYSVSYSRDGQKLVSGNHNNTVVVWDTNTNQALEIPNAHEKGVFSVAFSLQSNTIASGGGDGIVKLWDAGTGKLLQTLPGHNSPIWSVAYNPRQEMLASSSNDGTIKLWEVKTGQTLFTWQKHSSRTWSVAFSPDGRTLASGSDDKTIRLWNVHTGECIAILNGHESWVWSLAFSPDNNMLVSTSPDGTLRVWSTSTYKCEKVLSINTAWTQSATFSADSSILAVSTSNLTIQLLDVSTWNCVKTLEGHTNLIWSITYSPDNSTLASSSEDETIKLWNIENGICLRNLTPDKLYERMNIREATGLSEMDIAALKALGAVE